MNRTIRFAAIIIIIALCFALSTAVTYAELLTFTIDPTRSQLTLALESSPGAPFTTAQFPGSDTTSIYGTAASVDVTPTSIQFLSGGNIQFNPQSADVAPAVGGVYPGDAPGQYGLLGLIPGVLGGPGPGGTGLLAARGLVAAGTSGVIPLAGGAFDASQISLAFLHGAVDVNASVLGNPFFGTFTVVGSAGNNQLTSGTLTSAGGIDTLTVPIFSESSITDEGITVLQEFSGVLVATAVVPEPSTFLLAGCGLATCGLCVSRRFERPSKKTTWR